jgi:hypothetical protein
MKTWNYDTNFFPLTEPDPNGVYLLIYLDCPAIEISSK